MMPTIGSLLVKIGAEVDPLDKTLELVQRQRGTRAIGGELRIIAGRKRRAAVLAVMQANVWFETLRAGLAPRRRER